MAKITINAAEVEGTRRRIDESRQTAAARFRHSFEAQGELPPNERWRTHLAIQAESLLESSMYVKLREGYQVQYTFVDSQIVVPVAVALGAVGPVRDEASFRMNEMLFPFFRVPDTPHAVFEYWMLISEIVASAAWNLTWVIASPGEYGDHLSNMVDPQIVNALWVRWLPEVELREDGTASLDVSVYSRAGDERVERRSLMLDRENEFHFHGRELIAEGRGGIPV